MGDDRLDPLARLNPAVLGFSTARFTLRDDLSRLIAVSRVGAPEAVVFYGARVLEVLAGDALRRLGQTPAANPFSNLQDLEHFNRLDTAARYWGHALRRLGNMARHVQHCVGPIEAELTAHLVESWLEWFFCRFSHGDRLASLTRDEKPLALDREDQLRALMRFLEELEKQGPAASGPSGQGDVERNPAFLRTPVLSAVLAEILLSRKEFARALAVLDAALERFPDDLRLCQLKGLCWSRRGEPGDLEQAIDWLEPLHTQYANDEEMGGIIAGVYKRKWQLEPASSAALEKSHRAYSAAWKNSGKRNTYLGINSGTTALWLGHRDKAQGLAKEVETLLRARIKSLPADLADHRLAFHFWDQVTLAEAQLLLGNVEIAEQIYDAAFTQHATRTGEIDVCRRQRDEILRFGSSSSI